MDPTQTDKSIYRTLDSTISEIRLIKLQRGSGDEVLRCTLETVSLDDQPAFHALSYVWGAGTEKRQVNIDSHVVPVAPSLATVLEHFRSHHYDFLELHSSFLWIDAICINQADPKERAQQVRLMGRIYRQASRVLVWIGEGDELSDHAFDRINDAAFRASFAELKTASRAPTSDEVRVSTIFTNNLDKRRYWTRAWTLQEFVLATQDPVMFCGSRWMPWSWYRQCERNLPLPVQKMSYPSLANGWVKIKWETPFHPDSKEFTTPTKHETMRGWYQSNGSIPLVTALSQSFQFDATDPRDLIYGVLGLLPHHETLMVDIDYQKPPEQVFRDIVGAIWTSGAHGLISDAIPHLLSVGWADDKSEVPSWVPNVLRGTKTDLGSTSWLGASRRWRPDRQADIRVEGGILTMNAVRFDSVADTVALHFNHGWQERINRGKAPGEVDVEPLQRIEAMAREGLSVPIPASSRLAPFLALRDEMPVWSALTAGKGMEAEVELKGG